MAPAELGLYRLTQPGGDLLCQARQLLRRELQRLCAGDDAADIPGLPAEMDRRADGGLHAFDGWAAGGYLRPDNARQLRPRQPALRQQDQVGHGG